MKKTPLQINQFAKSIMAWREHHKFYTPSHLRNQRCRDYMLGKLMLVVTELAEAAEAVRHNDPENFAEELADTYIRLMDITAACEINVEIEIRKKMDANWKRPKRHGKKCSL